MNLFDLLLIVVLIICTVTDLRERKIYNNVIFPALGITLLLHGIQFGLDGLVFSFVGFWTGLAILLIPYFMGGMGAGDVKLLALIGAVKGAKFVFITAIYMGLLGGVLALGILLFRKGVKTRLKSLYYSFIGFKHGVKIPLAIGKEDYKTTYPYGVAIAGGAFLSFLLNGVSII